MVGTGRPARPPRLRDQRPAGLPRGRCSNRRSNPGGASLEIASPQEAPLSGRLRRRRPAQVLDHAPRVRAPARSARLVPVPGHSLRARGTGRAGAAALPDHTNPTNEKGPAPACAGTGPTKPDEGMAAKSETALQRLERWGDPNDHLAAIERPSLGVARHSGDTDPTPLGRLLVPSDPHGVSTPSGHSRGRASRADLRRTGAPLALSLSFRGPSQHPRTVPRTRRPACRTMLPLLGSRASRHIQNDGPAFHGASGPAACHVRGLGTPIAASTVVPPDTFRCRSVLGFTLQGVLLATIGAPSGAPCPLGVPRVDSPHPHGERADAAAFRASIPSRARSAIPDPEGSGAPMPS
jgi:hypothetical protein